MKRSEINEIMQKADDFIRKQNFYLPPFANWSLKEWKSKGPEIQEIIDANLGWDITDFGRGDYDRFGLLLFTIRNGIPSQAASEKGKTYCEKIMLVNVNQATPMHFHWSKAEDIINRGGGDLMVQIYNATQDDKLGDSEVVVSTDGVTRHLKAGTVVRLTHGESITLTQRMYHTFWAEKESVLAGEVSKVNDDHADNRFLEPIGRFPTIEEDTPPLHLLCNDYSNFLKIHS